MQQRSQKMDELKILTALLDTTNAAWELATEIDKPERLKQFVLELRTKAREERRHMRRDRIGTRYEQCMIGILEELSFLDRGGKGGAPWNKAPRLDMRLARIREEIERTIVEVKAKRKIM